MDDEANDLIKQIVTDHKKGTSGDTVIIFVPSHDKKEKELKDQQIWASEALDLFAKLFNGATGFENLLGTWYDRKKDIIHKDRPIMIQTLAPQQSITEANIKKVLEFGRRMGKKTNQACVGVVVNDIFYEIYDFGGD